MKKNVFLLAMLGMVLAFGLVVVGCEPESKPDTSISISGTAKVGETLTASMSNEVGTATWRAYNDVNCTQFSGTSPSDSNYYDWGDTWTLPTTVAGKYIRASVQGNSSESYYSNILGPVAANLDPLTDVTLTSAAASVTKGSNLVFTLKFKQGASFNSDNIVWSIVETHTAGTNISVGSVSLDGAFTLQDSTLTVVSGETATTLTVKVVYGTQEWTATVTVN